VKISVGVQKAGAAVLTDVLSRLTTDNGVHLESAAVALGALAGHACQVLVFGHPADPAGVPTAIVEGANGQTYYYGDAINAPLAESENSVWEIVSSAALALGGTVPDGYELFRHAAETVGGDDFGVPRYAPGTWSEPPVSFLPLWGPLLPIVTRTAPDPADWPVVYAVAIGDLFMQLKGGFPLEPLVRIAMDSAIAMSKLKQA
jgi:hypothetical protein